MNEQVHEVSVALPERSYGADCRIYLSENPARLIHWKSSIYNFAFGWAKEKGQKSLALDTAIKMWQLLFAKKQWLLVDHWCQFLQARHNKAISRDTWSQLLEFAKTVCSNLSDYDAEGAWPYLIDEFVEYLKENGVNQHGQINNSSLN
ncbi:hypothetical protein P8452_03914 [Trifolium repens]|nr:hypothetical protein P8452_03914 [Trifolium repens]